MSFIINIIAAIFIVFACVITGLLLLLFYALMGSQILKEIFSNSKELDTYINWLCSFNEPELTKTILIKWSLVTLIWPIMGLGYLLYRIPLNIYKFWRDLPD